MVRRQRQRLLAGAALVAALLVVLYVTVFSVDDTYTLTATVENAGQLVPGNEVRIGAVKVGEVSAIKLTPAGLAELTLEIDEDRAPLAKGTTATIRASSVVSSASRFIVLAPPATGRRKAAMLPDGGRIPLDNTTSPVDFDAFLNSFDPATRKGFQDLISGEATIYKGRARQIRQSTNLAAPALLGTEGVMKQLAKDRPALTRLLRSGAVAATAISSQRQELTQLVSNAATTASAIASQSSALQQSLEQLPPTLSSANTMYANLRSTLTELDRLVAVAKPATKDLTPFLQQLNPLLEEAKTTVPALSRIVTTPGPANDLTNLLQDTPALEQVSSKAFPRLVQTMDRSQDQLNTFSAYTPDLIGALTDVGQAASFYDANGHYIRALPAMSPYTYDQGTNVLSPTPGNARLAGFQIAKGRCPGSAIPALADGSAPVNTPGCNLTSTPPGP